MRVVGVAYVRLSQLSMYAQVVQGWSRTLVCGANVASDVIPVSIQYFRVANGGYMRSNQRTLA